MYCGHASYGGGGGHICTGTALEAEYHKLRREHNELLTASAELTKTYKTALEVEAEMEPPLHVGFVDRRQVDEWLLGGPKPVVHMHHVHVHGADVSDDPIHADCEPIYVFRD